jgi:hypothetical protein
VRLRTISRNSSDVGTGAMSFQVVFILAISQVPWIGVSEKKTEQRKKFGLEIFFALAGH